MFENEENQDFQNETNLDAGNSEDLSNSESSNDGNSENGNQESDKLNNDGAEEQKGRFDNLETANQSYVELEKKLGQQSYELGELRKKAELADQLQAKMQEQELQAAKRHGFETVEDYEDSKTIGNFLADEYSRFINQTDYPDETERLIEEFRKNPTQEILSTIEQELPIEAVKEVAGKLTTFRGQLQTKKNEALQQDLYNSAKSYLEENTKKYPEEFKNPAFAALYGEAFKAYGCDLNTDAFVGLMKEFEKSILAKAGVQQSINQENRAATDAIEGATLNGTQNLQQEKDILSMSEAEIRRELQKIK